MHPDTPADAQVSSDTWQAMGCIVQLSVVAPPSPRGADRLFDIARQTVEHLEASWSRFREHSDVRRLNRAGGRALLVDPATIELLEAMVAGYAATDGAFDPTMLVPLVGLGYDVSWSPGMVARSAAAGAPSPHRRGMTRVAIDRRRGAAQIPDDVSLDAGGIGKGLAADLTTARLLEHGASSVMLSIGGDLRIAGAPFPDGWPVDVADPYLEHCAIDRLYLGGGGVATSGSTLRRWSLNDRVVHHLLDPNSGEPLPGGDHDVVQATVVAGTAAWAEVFSTATMVRGLGYLADLDQRGLGALAVTGDGAVVRNQTWQTLAHPAGSMVP